MAKPSIGIMSVPANMQAESLLASAARTASANSGGLTRDYSPFSTATFFLDVTAVAAASTDTLDVFIDRLLPDGSTWDNIVHFTQVLGNGGAKKFVADMTAGTAAGEVRAVGDAVANSVRDVQWGSTLRVRWEIAGGTASFTFSLTAHFRV